MNVTIAKSTDVLGNNNYIPLSAFTTLNETSATRISFMTTSSATSAFITSISVSLDNPGAPGFTVNGPFWTIVDGNTYPNTASTTMSACSSIILTAIGRDGALGPQVVTWSVSLCSQALTGQLGNPLPYLNTVVDLSARTQTFTTSITARNTPYPTSQGTAGYQTGDDRAGGVFTSKSDFLRLWNLRG